MQQASVAELPFEAEQFEVVTAFETVYFWPELAQNFREVYRVLKPGGLALDDDALTTERTWFANHWVGSWSWLSRSP